MNKLTKLVSTPKIVGLVGDINEGKSMLIYHLIEEWKKEGKFNLYVYGLRSELKGATKIYSVNELEQIKNSIIVLDEVMSLWDLDNRMAKRQIERTLRLIFHNNNVLIICGVPENFRKFIAGKIHTYLFKKVTVGDFINGSKSKQIVTNYKGSELGTSVLKLEKNEFLLFDGLHYEKSVFPYYSKYDTKKNNQEIIKKVKKKVKKSVSKKEKEIVKESKPEYKPNSIISKEMLEND